MSSLYERWLEFRASMETPQKVTFTEHGQREPLPRKVKKNKRWPQLAGLSGRKYHTLYMRLQREADRRTT